MSSSRELELESDGFGFDPEFTELVKNVALWCYRKYWRVEVDGVQNVPARGRALLVANHAGIIPYDGAMIRTAILAEHPHPRHARMLVVDWAFAMPFTTMLLVKTGNVLAHPENATALLERDELAGGSNRPSTSCCRAAGRSSSSLSGWHARSSASSSPRWPSPAAAVRHRSPRARLLPASRYSRPTCPAEWSSATSQAISTVF